MKILFVIENYLPHIGGAEIVFKTLVEGLVQRGHEVNLVTHRLKNIPAFELLNGVGVHRVSCLQSRYLFTFFSLPKVIRLGREADIIHTTTFNGAPAAWLGGKLARKKVVLTIHEVWVGKWPQVTNLGKFGCLVHELLERLIYLLDFDCYACVSDSTKKDLLKLPIDKERTVTVYNGVDYNFWNPKKYDGKIVRKQYGLEENFVCLFNGRPGMSKGLEYLIKAMPLICRKIPSAKLLALVSRDKAYTKRYDYIMELIEKLKLKDKVLMLNSVPYKELPNYVKAADCAVVPSLAEGFGFTAAESCALGVPLVASDTTSLPEVVSGKFVLVRPKDERAIAEGVKRVFSGQWEKSELKKFTVKENIKNYLNIYQKLLA